MLCRTADSLYWMARYVERADFTARLLQGAGRMASLPSRYGGGGTEWDSVVAITDATATFEAAYEQATEANVRDFLCFDPANPSSIRSCLDAARENARSVRTALTSEAWETLNDDWNAMSRHADSEMEGFEQFLDWVKRVAGAFDGAAHRTMLRNDAYWFLRLGQGIERADNTARILDVKYHLLLPEEEPVGGTLDYFQWTTILRAVGALTAYRWVYKDQLKPLLVADLLLLNRKMPRSLAGCYESVVRHLDALAEAYGERGPAQTLATATLRGLTGQTVDAVFHSGLHEFITGFLADNDRLGAAVADQYLQ